MGEERERRRTRTQRPRRGRTWEYRTHSQKFGTIAVVTVVPTLVQWLSSCVADPRVNARAHEVGWSARAQVHPQGACAATASTSTSTSTTLSIRFSAPCRPPPLSLTDDAREGPAALLAFVRDVNIDVGSVGSGRARRRDLPSHQPSSCLPPRWRYGCSSGCHLYERTLHPSW